MDKLAEIITFDTEVGRYRLTRRERYRLAILHGARDAVAAQLAHRPAALAKTGTGFSADWLEQHFDAAGKQIQPFSYYFSSNRGSLAPETIQAPTGAQLASRARRAA